MTRHADPDALQKAVTNVIRASQLADRFKQLELEVDDDSKLEFIRVLIHVRDPEELSDEEVDALTSSIEDEITKYDDRFPSVRFSAP